MKKISHYLLTLILLVSFSLAMTPINAQAATKYCTGDGAGHDLATNTVVDYGDKKKGACHIAYYHMSSVGTLPNGKVKTTYVDGVAKSQFSESFDIQNMARIAGGIIAQGNITKQDNGNYAATGFEITLNQYVKVIYYISPYTDKFNTVVTMYPYNPK